jgi:hypothetical protein
LLSINILKHIGLFIIIIYYYYYYRRTLLVSTVGNLKRYQMPPITFLIEILKSAGGLKAFIDLSQVYINKQIQVRFEKLFSHNNILLLLLIIVIIARTVSNHHICID